MSDKPENPQAFPQSKPIYMAQDNGDGVMQPTIVGNGIIGGMTLRDYFAAAALAQTQFRLDTKFCGKDRENFIRDLSKACFEIADAMLAERGVK